jgi:hypothetical protein
LAFAFALAPVLERDESKCHVLALAREREADHADHVRHFRLLQDELFGHF